MNVKIHIIIISGRQLQQIQEDAKTAQRNAYALGTFDNFTSQWVTFLKFCLYFSLAPFPASTVTLVWYSQYLSTKLKSHSSLVSYLSGVKTLHNLLNYSVVGFSGFLLKITLRGLRRLNPHVVTRARPITPALLRAMHSQLDHDNPVHVVFWCASLFAFMLLFRKSNLLPDTIDGFNGERQLRQQDCVIDWNKRRIVVGIRWAKNHQFSKELLTFPLPELPGSVLCPLKALLKVRSMIPHHPNAHVFALPNGGSLTYRRFQNILRSTLDDLGIQNSNQYSSHSYRRGGTTFSFLCGIPSEVIQLLGSWRSQAFLSYLEFPLETRTAACELIKTRLMALK